jgi:hypothetical protein
MEVGYNTSTVAQRVVEDDKKGTRCLEVYNRATLSLGDIHAWTWTSRLGVGRKADDLRCKQIIVKCKAVKTGFEEGRG